jgi:hypothetical protein
LTLFAVFAIAEKEYAKETTKMAKAEQSTLFVHFDHVRNYDDETLASVIEQDFYRVEPFLYVAACCLLCNAAFAALQRCGAA